MAEQKEKFSRDADQTRYIFIVGTIGVSSLLILFILEMTAMILFKLFNTEGIYKPFIFTSEIVHTLIPVTVGTIGTVGGFLFGREMGKQQVQNGNTPQRGRPH